MTQRKADACDKIEEKGSFNVVHDDLREVVDWLAGLARVRVLHEKVFDHIYNETYFHNRVKDRKEAVLWLSEAREVGTEYGREAREDNDYGAEDVNELGIRAEE